MAQISITDENSFTCGGSIISANVILTAAHCVTFAKKNITVRVGSTLSGRGGELFKVSKVFIHPNYNPATTGFDVAVLILGKSIELEPKVKAVVELAAQDEKIVDETIVYVSGWGYMTNDKLWRVELPVANQKECTKAARMMSNEKLCVMNLYTESNDTCLGKDRSLLVECRCKLMRNFASFRRFWR
jgi:secreted trypsin-like serine protease